MDTLRTSPHSTAPVVADGRGAVVSIGVFDGVHRGHQSLVGLARATAAEAGVPLVVITFDPHPMAVVGRGAAPTSLATVAHRVRLLQAAGADEVDVLTFTPELAAMDPQEFVHRVLVDRLHARAVVVGQDFRFGHRAAGSFATLEQEGDRHGFRAIAAPLVGDGEHRWSSTSIRTMVTEGDVTSAEAALGRAYRLEGEVVHGDHRGRDLGFPTANLAWSGHPTIPADGVYAGWLGSEEGPLPAAISVGTNPQFDGRERRVESYVLDRDDLDLYGQEVTVDFAARLRGQARFDDVDALVAQMARDVDEAARILGGEPR